MSVAASDHFLQVREGEQGDEAHRVGPDHTVGGEAVLLIVVVGHHAQQRTVRDVDGSVNRHHHQIEGICVYAFADRAEVRSVEQQGEYQAERNRAENEPGTVGAPTRTGAVCEAAHDRVSDHVEESGDEHKHSRIREAQSENIRKEKREGDGHHFPHNATGRSVSERISDFFRKSYLLVRHCHQF